MFSFFNPGLLWALPAAAAPILIHLFFLRKARRLPFGDLTLLRRAYLKSLPASRLRQWLLLAVRCLLLACLVLAFARPVFLASSLSAEAGSEDEARMVLLLDTSYSMGYHLQGKTRLELAQTIGEDVLRLLRPQDQSTIVAFSDRVETPTPTPLEWTKDAASAIALLRRQNLSSRGTDYVPPLRLAYDFLKQTTARRKVIMVLSDNATHGWRTAGLDHFADSIPSYDPSVLLLGIGWKDSPENGAITRAQLRMNAPGRSRLLVGARIHGATRPQWDMDLWQEGRRIQNRHVNLNSAQETPVEFDVPSNKQSGVWGHIQMRADALPEDDFYYYSYWMQRRPRVLLVYGGSHALETGRGVYFLKKIFTDVQGSLLPYDLEIADSVRFKSLPLKEYRAVILSDFREIPEELPRLIEPYVRDGGGLWVMMGKNAELGSYRRLAKMLPARLEFLSDASDRDVGLKAGAGIEDIRDDKFSWKDFELQNVIVRRSYILAPAANTAVWFLDGQGRPLMVSGRWGLGRVLLWGSSLDIEWTNLAVKPAFAAWVDAALSHLTEYSNRMDWRTGHVGEPIVRTWSLAEPAPASVRIRNPQGRIIQLQVAQRKIEYRPEAAGVYLMDAVGDSDSRSEAFAVNLDRSTGESDMTVRGKLPWKPLNPQTLREDLTGALFGREVRTAIMGLVLLLLAIEMLLANR